MTHEAFNSVGLKKGFLSGGTIRPYKQVGQADFMVTDAENAVIAGMNGVSDQLAMEGFMTEGFNQGGGSWKVVVSSCVSKKTNKDGARRLTELLDEAGFKAETPIEGITG